MIYSPIPEGKVNNMLICQLRMRIDHRTGILKADVSSVSPSSERIEELWVVCRYYRGDGATLLVAT